MQAGSRGSSAARPPENITRTRAKCNGRRNAKPPTARNAHYVSRVERSDTPSCPPQPKNGRLGEVCDPTRSPFLLQNANLGLATRVGIVQEIGQVTWRERCEMGDTSRTDVDQGLQSSASGSRNEGALWPVLFETWLRHGRRDRLRRGHWLFATRLSQRKSVGPRYGHQSLGVRTSVSELGFC